MIKLFVLLVFVIRYTFFSFGQKKNDTIPIIELNTIVQVNQGNSYITFPTDIGNIKPLWFEGNLIPNFNIRVSKNSRLIGVLTPQIIIRMYQEKSYPVRTPSYIPQFTLYYLVNDKFKLDNITLFMRLAHHSNGQDGDFYLENGNINLLSGDFSTNYFELGVVKTNFSNRFHAYKFFKTSIEVHPESWSAYELKGQYSTLRWHNAFSIFKLPVKGYYNRRKKSDISIKGELNWMFGDLNQCDNFSLKRLNMSLTFYYRPKFLEDIGLFVKIFHGMDYYNIYFDHQLDVIRFGLMTEKLRF